MLGDAVLWIHAAAGAAALVAGPIVLRGGSIWLYQAAVAVVTTTAVALSAFDWERLWWLALIAAAVQAAALAGLREGLPAAWRVRFLAGTYVGLVTALLVVSWGSPLAWILPTVVGVPLVERAAHGVGRYTGPRATTESSRSS
jgi:hypothetical protein